jgi:hypothetical protein
MKTNYEFINYNSKALMIMISSIKIDELYTENRFFFQLTTHSNI